MDQQQKFRRTLKDIPELVERLESEKARQKDYLAPQEKIKFHVDDEGAGEVQMVLDGKDVTLGIMEQAHSQIAGKCEIPKGYYDRMLHGDKIDAKNFAGNNFPERSKANLISDKRLLVENLNHWMERAKAKKRFVRTVDAQVRGFLGGRYRPVSHLDLVTQAVMVTTGNEPGEHEQPWAKGARCFAWKIDPMNLDVEFVNPMIQVDLNRLDEGVKILDEKDFFVPDSPTHGWLRGQGDGKVFPTVRIRNSETGHGGLNVQAGLYESICDNSAHIGVSLAQIHVGRELTEAEIWSPDTHRKINEVIFAKTRDAVRAAFNPQELLKWAKRFKGLEDVEVADVKEATEHIIEIAGMDKGIRDEIMGAYYAMTRQRNNLFDLSRAFTGAAHAIREDKPEASAALEDLGGRIIEDGAAILTAKK